MENIVNKPYAQACDRNSSAILDVLNTQLAKANSVLEIGSGTGQHAVSFSRALPHLQWQTSDLEPNHPGIKLWIDEAKLNNILPPLTLDALQTEDWPTQRYDTIFTANTCHIMPMIAVEKMFQQIQHNLSEQGCFIIYGPFKYNGQHTSQSNIHFDQWLRNEEAHRGVREMNWLIQLAQQGGLSLSEDIAMPANNRILIWQR